MSDNTLTISLSGEVSLSTFADIIQHFARLVDLLTREVAADTKIDWLVNDLQAGSALATIEGISEHQPAVQRVVQAYENVGISLQRGEPIEYSESVDKEARAITKVIGREIPSVTFQTAQRDAIVYGNYLSKSGQQRTRETIVSLGAVKGTVETLSRRGNLKFSLYDPIFDRPITCYVKEDGISQLKDIWGKDVIVYGRVTREPENGRAISIRDINRIEEVVTVQPGSYKAARGVFHWAEGDEPAEATIRRIRDAE